MSCVFGGASLLSLYESTVSSDQFQSAERNMLQYEPIQRVVVALLLRMAHSPNVSSMLPRSVANFPSILRRGSALVASCANRHDSRISSPTPGSGSKMDITYIKSQQASRTLWSKGCTRESKNRVVTGRERQEFPRCKERTRESESLRSDRKTHKET